MKNTSPIKILGLPDEIANDQKIKQWRKFTKTGALVSEFKRLPTSHDTEAIINCCEIVQFPQFFGEWVQTPQSEIDKFNEERLNKTKSATVRQQTARELEIEKAQALLRKLLDKVNGVADDVDNGEGGAQ